MKKQGYDSDLLVQYITQLKDDLTAPAPAGLDDKSITFAQQLVNSRRRKPAALTKERMWQAALATAEQTDQTPPAKIIPMPGSAITLPQESARLAQRQNKRRRGYSITAAASLFFAIAMGLLLATTGRLDITEEPDQVGGGTAVAQTIQAGFIPVVMASEPILPGTLIEADMLTTVMWPEELPLPGPVYSDVEEVIGMYCRGETSDFMPLLNFNMTDDTPISFEMPARIVNDL